MWWTEEKIEWYERASSLSDYHMRLASAVERYLEKDEDILEAGCGLGHVAALLSLNHPVTAIDIDRNAVEHAAEREKRNIYRTRDWKECRERFSCVLSICFGHLERKENLETAFRNAERHVIYVFSLHSGQNSGLVSRRTMGRDDFTRFLLSSGYTCRSEELLLSFPQPLLSRDEARRFISLYYPEMKIEDYMAYVTESGNEKYPYILKNEKKMLLFDIRRGTPEQ